MTTIDTAEIARFDALAEQWWDPTGPMWPLHRLNATRVPFIEHQLSALSADNGLPVGNLNGLRILDVGCGAGLLSESMALAGASVSAVDASSRNIAIAREHAQTQGLSIDYQVGDITTLNLPEFDVVLNMEVIEHVNKLPDFFRRCCELCRPGGIQFVATINRNLLSYLVAIVAAEYILGWLPRGTHQWRKFVRPAELTALLADNGFSISESTGVTVNPLQCSVALSSLETVNYMMSARRDE